MMNEIVGSKATLYEIEKDNEYVNEYIELQ